jgi:gliding motility-associated-like protein
MTYLWSTSATTAGITAQDSGVIWVEVNGHCGADRDSVHFILHTTPVVELGPERVFCGNVLPFDLTVGKAENGEVYLWSNQQTNDQIQVSEPGDYWVQLSNSCGTASDSLTVRISPYPLVDLGPDTSLCGDFELELDAQNPGMSYLWEPFGETSQKILATEQAVYTVHVSNQDGCTTTHEFEITGDCISHYHIPSAFSPNNDGYNEFFKPVLVNYERYEMKIYDRWGELLFVTNDINEGWDGSYKGEIVPVGTYLYVVNFVTTEDLKHNQVKGLLLLVR